MFLMGSSQLTLKGLTENCVVCLAEQSPSPPHHPLHISANWKIASRKFRIFFFFFWESLQFLSHTNFTCSFFFWEILYFLHHKNVVFFSRNWLMRNFAKYERNFREISSFLLTPPPMGCQRGGVSNIELRLNNLLQPKTKWWQLNTNDYSQMLYGSNQILKWSHPRAKRQQPNTKWLQPSTKWLQSNIKWLQLNIKWFQLNTK